MLMYIHGINALSSDQALGRLKTYFGKVHEIDQVKSTNIYLPFLLTIASFWFIIAFSFDNSDEFDALSLITDESRLGHPEKAADYLISKCPSDVYAGRADTGAGFWYLFGAGP